MRRFTKRRDLSRWGVKKMPHCKPPKEIPPLIFREEAVQRITEMVTELASEKSPLDSDTGAPLPLTLADWLTSHQKTLEFRISKLVEDILAYCHRWDFPESLIYTAVELILKRLDDILAAAKYAAENEGNAPLSKVKMDDTEFDFDTSVQVALQKVDINSIVDEKLFDSLKPRLNLYRRVCTL